MGKLDAHRLIGALVATIWVLASCNGMALEAAIYTDWSRDLAVTTPSKYRLLDQRFYAGVTGSLGGVLHLLCRYGLPRETTTGSLNGSRDADGNFWPAVTLAVSNSREANWKPISIFNPTVDLDVLRINHRDSKLALWVGAEPFRSLIGTYRWGRVVLIDDKQAETVFALEDLLPPKDRRPRDGDFKEVLDDREKPRFESAALLYSVTSIRNHLAAEFVYLHDHPLGTIEGVTTEAGDFWPRALLAVGDSDAHWTNVGEADQRGTAGAIQAKQNIRGSRTGSHLFIQGSRTGSHLFIQGGAVRGHIFSFNI